MIKPHHLLIYNGFVLTCFVVLAVASDLWWVVFLAILFVSSDAEDESKYDEDYDLKDYQ